MTSSTSTCCATLNAAQARESSATFAASRFPVISYPNSPPYRRHRRFGLLFHRVVVQTRSSLLFLLSICPNPAFSQDMDNVLRAGNNLSHEHMECSAFYTLSSYCIRETPNGGDLADRYIALATTMEDRGRRLGTSAKLSEKAATARFEMALKQMMSDLEGSCSNISVILNEHADDCRSLAEDPEAAFARQLR